MNQEIEARDTADVVGLFRCWNMLLATSDVSSETFIPMREGHNKTAEKG